MTSEASPGPCLHWRTPVVVGGHTLLCSAWLAAPEDRAARSAADLDAGFYLDTAWLQQRQPPFRSTTIAWPDFGVIHPGQLSALTTHVLDYLEAGRSVEIGCLGGHGRTGTLLASLIARAESVSPGEAMVAARARFCGHAIETPAQEALLHTAAAFDRHEHRLP